MKKLTIILAIAILMPTITLASQKGCFYCGVPTRKSTQVVKKSATIPVESQKKEVATIESQIATLKAENQRLKKQLTELQNKKACVYAFQ